MTAARAFDRGTVERARAATLAGDAASDAAFPCRFEIDPAGFPLVWVEAIGAWMHWLPVSKLQFEHCLLQGPDRGVAAGWYDHLLALNPRVAPARVHSENYCNALLTGLLPAEAQRIAAWLGADFAIPTADQWLRAWSSLDSQPAGRGLPAELALRLEEPVRTLLTRIDSAATATAVSARRRPTLADQMLLRGGVLEWVTQEGGSPRWVGIGEPPRLARGIRVCPDRGPVAPERPEAFRSYLFGARLIRKP